MNSKSMANFICELRKSKKLTQKQLAERLNITDKAVSKWERGLGYPDIAILPSLAEVLGVTANELLSGEMKVSSPVEVNTIVETTLQYADKVVSSKKESAKNIAKIVITVACMLSILVCAICDMAISGTFTWSLYPFAAILFGWLIIIPLFLFNKNEVRMSLVSLSLFIIPFLFIVDKIIGGTKFMLPLGIPVAVTGIAYLWIMYFLLSAKKALKWNMAAISILLGIPVSLIVNYTVAKFTKEPIIDVWDILSCGIMIMTAILVFLIGRRRKNDKTYRSHIS